MCQTTTLDFASAVFWGFFVCWKTHFRGLSKKLPQRWKQTEVSDCTDMSWKEVWWGLTTLAVCVFHLPVLTSVAAPSSADIPLSLQILFSLS